MVTAVLAAHDGSLHYAPFDACALDDYQHVFHALPVLIANLSVQPQRSAAAVGVSVR
jgi:hypothetical protein